MDERDAGLEVLGRMNMGGSENRGGSNFKFPLLLAFLKLFMFSSATNYDYCVYVMYEISGRARRWARKSSSWRSGK